MHIWTALVDFMSKRFALQDNGKYKPPTHFQKHFVLEVLFYCKEFFNPKRDFHPNGKNGRIEARISPSFACMTAVRFRSAHRKAGGEGAT